MSQIVTVKGGASRRAAFLGIVLYAGCTAFDHHNCVEYPSLFGPCSWSHSAWEILLLFVCAMVCTTGMLGAFLWVTGILPIKR